MICSRQLRLVVVLLLVTRLVVPAHAFALLREDRGAKIARIASRAGVVTAKEWKRVKRLLASGSATKIAPLLTNKARLVAQWTPVWPKVEQRWRLSKSAILRGLDKPGTGPKGMEVFHELIYQVTHSWADKYERRVSRTVWEIGSGEPQSGAVIWARVCFSREHGEPKIMRIDARLHGE